MNFNPRSPHGERQFRATFQGDPEQISTHAPRTGSDFDLFFAHAVNGRFQPTLPARGATRLAACRVSGSTISTHAPRTGSDTTNCIVEISTTHFNPRSPHGERRGLLLVRWDIPSFQSTLPARGATKVRNGLPAAKPFQSTLPARGATRQRKPGFPAEGISIHAPRTGSDKKAVM